MHGPPLRTVSRTSGANRALKEGRISPATCALDIEEVPVLVHAFRRMVRELEYDVCEMALTTYLCAREHGVRFTALPIFLVRGFHHGAIVVNEDAGITRPSDLEGRRVGVNRGWTVTTGVWARAILQAEHGVDLDAITWVRSGDEHVEGYRPPANVVDAPPGTDLAAAVASGDLDAAVNVKSDDPAVVPLLPGADEAGFAALRTRGHYPINHLVVVRDDVLAARPDLPADLFAAFAAAKDAYVDQLRRGGPADPTSDDRMYGRVLEITGADPLPYGIEPNRAVLEELIDHAVTQRILRQRPADLESLFAAGSRELTG
jgi:4,5-dihydroxyphthalate decarboxylase